MREIRFKNSQDASMYNKGYQQGRADGIRSTFDAIKSMLKMGISIERIELLMVDELKEQK